MYQPWAPCNRVDARFVVAAADGGSNRYLGKSHICTMYYLIFSRRRAPNGDEFIYDSGCSGGMEGNLIQGRCSGGGSDVIQQARIGVLAPVGVLAQGSRKKRVSSDAIRIWHRDRLLGRAVPRRRTVVLSIPHRDRDPPPPPPPRAKSQRAIDLQNYLNSFVTHPQCHGFDMCDSSDP